MASEADFEEIAGSPKGSYSEDGKLVFTRIGMTDWDLVTAFAAYLMPATIVVGDQIEQKLPAPFPGNGTMFVQHFDVEGFGEPLGADANGLFSYTKAKWTIQYGVPKYDVSNSQDPVPFLNHEWSVGGEFLTIEANNLVWASGVVIPPGTLPSTLVNSNMRGGLIVPTFETSIAWERVTDPPFAAMRSCVGCVNNASITFDTGTCEKETLLFLGAKLSRQIMSDGSRAWKVTYQFSEKISPRQLLNATDKTSYPSGGWNFYLDPDTSTFRRMLVTASPSNLPIYNSADFNTLFQAG